MNIRKWSRASQLRENRRLRNYIDKILFVWFAPDAAALIAARTASNPIYYITAYAYVSSSFDYALKTVLRDKSNFGILEGFLSELLKKNIGYGDFGKREQCRRQEGVWEKGKAGRKA